MALAWYDPDSPIRLRVVHAGGPATIDEAWWRRQAEKARARRSGLEASDTTGFRWIHGENDGFPAMVLDRYDDTLVLKLYSAVWLPRLEMLLRVVDEVFEPGFLMLRLSRNLREAAAAHGIHEGFVGRVGAERVVFRENGLAFEAEVRRGQKTGFFLDQREHRARVGAMAGHGEVLNLFSFSGGFSVYAACGGARRVVDVDISRHALESSRRNFALNPQCASAVHETVQADVFRWLEDGSECFDLVICDPPSLAQRKQDGEKAAVAYRRLNSAAMARVRPGGVLLSASCSAHVKGSDFFGLVRQQAADTGRGVIEHWTGGHAIDHPVEFPEAAYLKAICLELGQP
jgi:23S rRNA (cytosine1962-C5)-methyltransferase